MTTQVVSRQLQGGAPNNTTVCDLASSNASFTVTKDDSGSPFRFAVPTNCNLTVLQNSTLLTTANYTVRAAVGLNSTCVNTKLDANTRQFSAQANVNYSFTVYLANAPATPTTYKLNVAF